VESKTLNTCLNNYPVATKPDEITRIRILNHWQVPVYAKQTLRQSWLLQLMQVLSVFCGFHSFSRYVRCSGLWMFIQFFVTEDERKGGSHLL